MAAIHESLDRSAREFPERIAIRADDSAWSFSELAEWSANLAVILQSKGIGAGDRVALRMANRVEFLVAVCAVSRVGASSVMLSPAWRETEIRHAVGLTEPSLAIVDDADEDELAVHLGNDRVIHVDDDPIGRGVDELGTPLNTPDDPDHGVTTGEPDDRVTPGVGGSAHDPGTGATPGVGDPAGDPGSGATATSTSSDWSDSESVLVFSSGTTGLPKAVRHTHGSLEAATRHWVEALGLTPDDRFQVATPPSHILGLLNLLVGMDVGVTIRLHRRFDLEAVLHHIEADKLTLEMAVAPIALALANHPDLESHDLSSLRYIMWGATPVTESVAREVTERSGVGILAAYGASELPVLAANPVADPSSWRLDSAGIAPEGVELRVVDLESGEQLPAGETGEIEARSASMMSGYLPEEANTDAFHDGWYRTGDVGWIEPSGWVHLTDRSKEMIKVSGFQVAPAEIEAVLHSHPSVQDCAVFGVPHDRTGEAPVAAVQAVAGAEVDPDDLAALVSERLATYKRLSEVVIVDEIPRLPSGKVLRRTLRDTYLEAVT